MKVAFVIQKLAGIRGGAERIAVETAKAMALRGHQVSLVTFEPANGPPGYDPGSVPVSNLFPAFSARRRAIRADRHDGTVRKRRLEAMLKQVPDLFPLSHLKWIATHGFFARRLRGMIRAERPDIVVAVMKPAITAAAFAARGTGTRVIASTHNVMAADYGSATRWDRNPLYLHRSVEAFEHCDAILVLLEEFRDWFPDHLKPRVTVMPNPVARLCAAVPGTRRRKVVLGVGRLTRVKRFDLLISAWAGICDRYPDWSVEICGSGAEAGALQEQIDAAGIGGRVRLLGAREDIGTRYDEAAILCHPAAFEGFGLAVGEALAHGLPPIAFSDCPGVNWLIRSDENGVLVDPSDDRAEALARALGSLMSSDALRDRLGAAGPSSVAAYAPNRIYDRWDKILRAL